MVLVQGEVARLKVVGGNCTTGTPLKQVAGAPPCLGQTSIKGKGPGEGLRHHPKRREVQLRGIGVSGNGGGQEGEVHAEAGAAAV